MSQKIYDEKYEKYVAELFDSVLPEKLYDAHFHIARWYTEMTGYNGEPFEEYREFTEKYTMRKFSGGMVMPAPSRLHKTEDLDEENAYNLLIAEKYDLEAGLLMSPEYGREKAEKMLDTYKRIKVLKPYLCYSKCENKFEADITDFVPEWMWSLANDRKMPLMIHLSHYNDMLSDTNNLRQLLELCPKYPDAKIILAHCAMGHHVRKLRMGLEHIKDLKNIWFDCSGSTEAPSIYYCIKTFGVEKMMYGGDFNHAANMGRICSFGSNFIGFHEMCVNEGNIPPDYKYHPLNNGQECILALLDACELLDLSKKDMEDIFYNNAVRMFRQ